MDDEMMKAMGFSGFGKKSATTKRTDLAAVFNKTIIKNTAPEPLLPKPPPKLKPQPQTTDDSDYEDHDIDDPSDNLPITHKIVLRSHSKTVSALSLDSSGARLITGGRDEYFKLWDFNGMDSTMKSFRTIDEPFPGHPVRDIQFNPSGDKFIAASGTAQPKLFDREGAEIREFVKGDPYIRDSRKTSGHSASLTSARWHPTDKTQFMTSGYDSTIRLWDCEHARKNREVISVKSKAAGGRTPMLCTTYTNDGKLVVAGGQDGGIRMWNTNGPYIRPTIEIDNAHASGSGISSIATRISDKQFTTRGLDDTVKTWDIRAPTKPISIHSSLPNFFEESSIGYSPDEKYIVTGISVKKHEMGKLMIFNTHDLSLAHSVDLGIGASVVRVQWHSKINQIIAGCGDGNVNVLYDPMTSIRGAKLVLEKQVKVLNVDDMACSTGTATNVIINPHALPMYRDEEYNPKRKRGKVLRDPILTKKPELPVQQSKKMQTLAVKHIMETMIKDSSRNEDPREALLKHAEEAAANPLWVAPAYKKTQPNPNLADSVFEDDLEEKANALKKRRQGSEK